MKMSDVLTLLDEQQNPRGIEHWNNMENTAGLKSYGLGLTQHRKLAKKIGRSHELAAELWQSDYYDAKVVSLLIDEPKKLTVEQIEKQVDEISTNGKSIGLFTHIFSSCDATLPKAPFAFELANNWIMSKDETRRRCGYGLIYEFSKKKSKKYTDDFFMEIVERIDVHIEDETTWGRMSMGSALMGIGKRSKPLNAAALKVATRVGAIDFNDGSGKCEPFDVVKHLTSDYLKEKLKL